MMINEEPNNNKYNDAYKWYLENEEAIELSFLEPGTVHVEGLIIYTANI